VNWRPLLGNSSPFLVLPFPPPAPPCRAYGIPFFLRTTTALSSGELLVPGNAIFQVGARRLPMLVEIGFRPVFRSDPFSVAF